VRRTPRPRRHPRALVEEAARGDELPPTCMTGSTSRRVPCARRVEHAVDVEQPLRPLVLAGASAEPGCPQLRLKKAKTRAPGGVRPTRGGPSDGGGAWSSLSGRCRPMGWVGLQCPRISRRLAVGDVSVRRWRRYGRDRLYVTDAGGRSLGWHDLVTGETHVAVADAATDVAAAVSEWRAAGGMASVTVAESEPARRDPVPVPPFRDLVDNQPGELARARAVALRQAAPVRTFAERLLGLRTEERAWRIGAAGEVRVAGDLAQLRRRRFPVVCASRRPGRRSGVRHRPRRHRPGRRLHP
jgi:hypothetical protein